VVHLHAHDSYKRENETLFLASKIAPLLEKDEKVILMGDLNSLSPLDKGVHQQEDLTHLLGQPHALLPNLRQKFLNDSGDINYQPIQNLLNSGLIDSCAASCEQHNHFSDNGLPTPKGGTHQSIGSLQACMNRQCRASEPTSYNPEWGYGSARQPDMRLDFILVSPALISTPIINNANYEGMKGQAQKREVIIVEGGVEANNRTKFLSDHFPVYFYWREPVDIC